MPIRYALLPNKLTADPTGHRARVEPDGSVSLDDLMTAIARPGSTVTRAEMLAFWEEFSAEIIRQLESGHRVVLDLFRASVSIEGVFHGPDDQFDPLRHTPRIRLVANTRLRKAATGLRFERVPAPVTGPRPERLEDFTTDATADQLTPGGLARLSGRGLRFDAADPQQGLYLTAPDGHSTPVIKIKSNSPRELLFVVPTGLAPGPYQLEVRTTYRSGSVLKTAAYPVHLQTMQ